MAFKFLLFILCLYISVGALIWSLPLIAFQVGFHPLLPQKNLFPNSSLPRALLFLDELHRLEAKHVQKNIYCPKVLLGF